MSVSAISDLYFETDIAGLTVNQARLWGFRSGNRGTHTSRTIMLEELSCLLHAVPRDAVREDYANAVLVHNCLGKRTASTRKSSFQRLSELYALDPRVKLFRIMRELWSRSENSRPLLALLLALVRDPLLRITASAVLRIPYGNEFTRQSMEELLSGAVGDRLNEATLNMVVTRASSSWTQSGHLRGSRQKIRQRVEATPAATMFALLISFAVGRRGQSVFETPWVVVLDMSPDELIDVAVDASRLGLLNFKQSGLMIDVSFPALFSDQERELIFGTHQQVG